MGRATCMGATGNAEVPAGFAALKLPEGIRCGGSIAMNATSSGLDVLKAARDAWRRAFGVTAGALGAKDGVDAVGAEASHGAVAAAGRGGAM